MKSYEEALELINSQPSVQSFERVEFMDSIGRVLAEDIVSDVNMPPFNKSAMDGYACKSEDLPGPLKVCGEVAAGDMLDAVIEEKCCVKIMTGAPVPQGADCVIMEEHTKVVSDDEILFTKDRTKTNICYLGEDVQIGDVLINKGTLIKPEHVAIMASAGITEPLVTLLPAIGVYSTGNELVEPDQKPDNARIRNSNGFQITAQLKACGFKVDYLGIIPDNIDDTKRAIEDGFTGNDVLVLTGGVSFGKYDFVPEALRKCDVEILFHNLAVQPGKPSLFGKRSNDKFVFALPGNPVSSFIQTELLVKQLCYKLQGYKRIIPEIKIQMGEDYFRKRTTRKSFLPVMIKDSKIFPVEYHGSAHIQALNVADGIISIEPGINKLNQGDLVNVRLF